MSRPEQEADRLSEQAEALLDGWPAPSRSALEWEDLANSTVARIREADVGSTTDDLLAPPLPKEEGEGELSADAVAPAPEPADEPGLLAIAKAAVSTGSGEDAKDIVRAGLRAAEYSRQSHPPAPPTRVGRQRGTPSSAAGLQGHLPKSSTRPVEAVHAAQARSELPAHSKQGGDKVGPGVVVAGAMLALAAGVALYVGMHANRTETAAATSYESAQAPVTPASPAAEAPPAAASSREDKPRMLALDDLKPTEPEPAPKEPGKVVVPSATSPMSLALNTQDEKASAKSARSTPPKAAAPDLGNAQAAPPAQQKAGGLVLKETEEAAVATKEGSAPQPGAADKQALPNRPSVGAIQGAVGSVMAGARSCLAGQETGSKATVTFGADGHVKSVSVAGPAAGTPAEGCVRSALMGARVPPFSEPEYSASFTVRPP